MARKPHKFAHNGVSLSTTLSETNLRAICAVAAVESTGDLWNGKQKIVETGSGDGWISFLIKDGLLGWSKLLNFTVTFGDSAGRTTLETEIITYMTLQPTLYGIPAGPKKMTAHHTYMQFVHKMANTVQQEDVTASIRISEGVAVAGGAAEASAPAVAPPLASPPPPPASVPISTVAPDPIPSLGPPPPPPPPPPTPNSPEPEPEPAMDQTQRVVRRPRGPLEWMLAPDGLPERPLARVTYLGRDPTTPESDAVLIPVPGDEFTVSKTHARIDYSEGVVHVTDLDSTNGTFLVDRFDDMVQCEPNMPTEVKPGVGLELGGYAITLAQTRAEASA